jgi:thiol-disulfide isomerase/thioredoxin
MPVTRRAFVALAAAALARPAWSVEGGGLVRHETPRPLAPVILENRAGEAIRLGDLRGKVIVLHLWASWCASCKTEFPSLLAFDAAFRPRQVTLVTVSLDRLGWSTTDRTLTELSARALPVFLDRERTLLSNLKARGLPTSVVIDREGREIARATGPLDWTSPDVAAFFERLL